MSEKEYILRNDIVYTVAERGLIENNDVGGITTPLNICIEHLFAPSVQGAVTTTQDV